ncbi:MAG TPA: hypothetical protein VJ506_07025 [Candidatus Limnocylindrales bacterium]|nr:hypothetical protein [Candidatus Limnocylindrales bacterium]
MDIGRADLGRLIFGLIVLFVGVWFLLRNTFGVNLPELDGDMIWPILVVGLGLAILFNTGRHGSQPRA